MRKPLDEVFGLHRSEEGHQLLQRAGRALAEARLLTKRLRASGEELRETAKTTGHSRESSPSANTKHAAL